MPDTGIFNELSEEISLRLKSCREESHDKCWTEYKVHIDYDMWFVRSGTVDIRIADSEHRAVPGDIVFFYPGIPYQASTGEEGCSFVFAHYDFGIGEQQRMLRDFRLSGVVPGALIQEEADLFLRSYSRSGQWSSNRLHVKACLSAVVARIVELHGQDLYVGTFPEGSAPRRSERGLDELRQVFTFIHANVHRPVKMGELAALVGLSEKYFITYFKQTLGITPGQYIYQVKMNQARDYLYRKKFTVQQIASFLGYPDPFSFSKAFKKYYRVPPSKFE